jgi:RHS repeat-associated protein
VLYLSDAQQSPVVLANAQGEVVSERAYHPFGALRTSAGQSPDPRHFVGNEIDPGSGLGDFQARPYRQDAGIFLAPDPVATFPATDLTGEPNRFFAYAYSGGDPINRVDPQGEFWLDLAVDAGFIGYDLYRIGKDNVFGNEGNLGENLLALGADVVCAAVPLATGGGAAVRAARSRAVREGAERGVTYLYGGSRRASQAQMQQARAPRGGAAASKSGIQGLGNIGSHGPMRAGDALEHGQKWLGRGYTEIGPNGSGVFRSSDGLRQFRMTNGDLNPLGHGAKSGLGSHVHFEALDARGRIIENLHIPLAP